MKVPWLVALAAAAILAQDSPTFEVASVKPANNPPGAGFTMWTKGGPGTGDPTRIDFHNVSLGNLVCMAYWVDSYQLTAPDWLHAERVDIVATLASGTTKEQFSLMLRNLLADRFKLQVHHDRKEMMSYSLTVAKGGPKLQAHVEMPAPADDAPKPFGSKTDSEGYPIVPCEGGAMSNGRARMKYLNWDVDAMSAMFGSQLDSPVHNDTGVTGKYDFELKWSFRPLSAGDNAPDFITAVQEQLGLKLEKKKASVDVVVVDRAEKTPTGN